MEPCIFSRLHSHRYSSEGLPVETKLVDLQVSRRANGIVDLLHFTHVSMGHEARTTNLSKILKAYHDTFSDIMTKAKMDVPFTLKVGVS